MSPGQSLDLTWPGTADGPLSSLSCHGSWLLLLPDSWLQEVELSLAWSSSQGET